MKAAQTEGSPRSIAISIGAPVASFRVESISTAPFCPGGALASAIATSQLLSPTELLHEAENRAGVKLKALQLG